MVRLGTIGSTQEDLDPLQRILSRDLSAVQIFSEEVQTLLGTLLLVTINHSLARTMVQYPPETPDLLSDHEYSIKLVILNPNSVFFKLVAYKLPF